MWAFTVYRGESWVSGVGSLIVGLFGRLMVFAAVYAVFVFIAASRLILATTDLFVPASAILKLVIKPCCIIQERS